MGESDQQSGTLEFGFSRCATGYFFREKAPIGLLDISRRIMAIQITGVGPCWRNPGRFFAPCPIPMLHSPAKIPAFICSESVTRQR